MFSELLLNQLSDVRQVMRWVNLYFMRHVFRSTRKFKIIVKFYVHFHSLAFSMNDDSCDDNDDDNDSKSPNEYYVPMFMYPTCLV